MSDLKICPCGIAADDCDYHKPETKECSLYPGSEVPTVRVRMADGTWYQVICFKDDKLDDLNRIAEQVADYHHAQVIKALAGAYGVV